jgi:hypothetical protein
MAITIRILKQVTVSPGGSFPDTITAEFAIQNDAVSSTWYRWTRGSIPGDTADVPAFLAAEGASRYTEAQAGGVTMTPNQVNTGNYAWEHWQYRDVFADASFRLEVGMLGLGTAPSAAVYRTMLNNALEELTPLAGTQFETHFGNKRASKGFGTTPSAPVGALTLAQCDVFDSFLREWLSARRSDVLWAKSIVGLV